MRAVRKHEAHGAKDERALIETQRAFIDELQRGTKRLQEALETVGGAILVLSRGVDLRERISQERGDPCPRYLAEQMRGVAAACLGLDLARVQFPQADPDADSTGPN